MVKSTTYEASRITRDYLRSEQHRMVVSDPFRRKNRLASQRRLARLEAREARAEMVAW